MVELIERFKKDFQDQIGTKNLQEWAKFLADQDETAFVVDHTGTLFKLYILYSYIKWPYLKIMANQRQQHHTKLIFIDLYAGNGLNKISTPSEIYVLGSSLLALLAAYLINNLRNYDGYFDHMVLIDKNAKSIESLQNRCKIILNELGENRITVGDSLSSNSRIITLKSDIQDSDSIMLLSNWLDSIWKNNLIHTLLFVDPDRAANFSMNTLIKLLRFPGDLFVLLHTETFVEMVNKERYNPDTIQNMLGVTKEEVSKIFELKTNKEKAEYYVRRFESTISETQIDKLKKGSNRREVIITIPITIGTNANYYLLYATRKTGGNDSEKWQEGFMKFANDIRKMSEVGKTALEVLKGPQKTIDEF
jgi:three-Cys-motif partner protein